MKNTLVATLLLASCGYLSYAQNNVTVKGQIKGVVNLFCRRRKPGKIPG